MPHHIFDSPIGPLILYAEDGALVRIDLKGGLGHRPNRARAEARSCDSVSILQRVETQLAAYFSGQDQRFDLPLVLHGTAFQQRVWAALQKIPFGETRTYGDIARALGSSPRAVGGACGRNPIPIIVPCHRVVAAEGGLGGYTGLAGLDTKRFLLNLERPS